MFGIQKSANRRSKALPPLENGDHLDQKTFHERYEAMPPDCRAELIGGIVYMSSPQKSRHGKHHFRLAHWLGEYEAATPGVEGHINTTQILADDSEPQPDAGLFILPEYGGHVWEDDREFLRGTPEWIGEISDSTESMDLNRKKRDYEIAGVREYMVAAIRSRQIFWFIRRRGKFKELSLANDGIFRSEVFPGLWLDPAAFLKRDSKRLLGVLRQGLASSEHAAFVAKLAAKKA